MPSRCYYLSLTPSWENRLVARWIHRIKSAAKHLTAAVSDPAHVASFFPSSRFTIRSIVGQLPEGPVRLVEYGAGTGNITRALLETIPNSGHLISIEGNGQFMPTLMPMQDSRFTVIKGFVPSVLPGVKSRFPEGAHAVVSGIPFTVMPPATREEIFAQTYDLLAKGGRFIAYQNSRLIMPLFRKHFSKVWVMFEPRNFLPYFIMVGEK